MIRAIALTALLFGFAGVALAADPAKNVPPELNPEGKTSEQQKCQAKCAEPIATCMTPCAQQSGNVEGDDKARAKMMACVKKCTDAQAPCLKACEKKKAKP